MHLVMAFLQGPHKPLLSRATTEIPRKYGGNTTCPLAYKVLETDVRFPRTTTRWSVTSRALRGVNEPSPVYPSSGPQYDVSARQSPAARFPARAVVFAVLDFRLSTFDSRLSTLDFRLSTFEAAGRCSPFSFLYSACWLLATSQSLRSLARSEKPATRYSLPARDNFCRLLWARTITWPIPQTLVVMPT